MIHPACVRIFFLSLLALLSSCEPSKPKAPLYVVADWPLLVYSESEAWAEALGADLERALASSPAGAKYRVVLTGPQGLQGLAPEALAGAVVVRLWLGFPEALSLHTGRTSCPTEWLTPSINYRALLGPLARELAASRARLAALGVKGVDLWVGGFLRASHLRAYSCPPSTLQVLGRKGLYTELQDALATHTRGLVLSMLLNVDQLDRQGPRYAQELREQLVQGVIPFVLPRL